VFVFVGLFIVLFGKDGVWFHHCIVDRISKIVQNDARAKSQFIGDKWGIIKSPMAIKSWQDFVIVYILTRF